MPFPLSSLDCFLSWGPHTPTKTIYSLHCIHNVKILEIHDVHLRKVHYVKSYTLYFIMWVWALGQTDHPLGEALLIRLIAIWWIMVTFLINHNLLRLDINRSKDSAHDCTSAAVRLLKIDVISGYSSQLHSFFMFLPKIIFLWGAIIRWAWWLHTQAKINQTLFSLFPLICTFFVKLCHQLLLSIV